MAQLRPAGQGQPPPPGFRPQPQGYEQPPPYQDDPPATGHGAGAGYAPKYGNETDFIEDSTFTGRGFDDKTIRLNFIRRVYLLLFAQIAVTFGIVTIFTAVPAVRNFIQGHFYLYIIAYVAFIILYIALVCGTNLRRTFPGNFIALTAFTLVFSYMAGTIASYHNTEAVMICMGITVCVCLAVSLFACQTKIDFTMCSGLLFCLIMVLFFFGFACLIVNFTLGPSKILQCVYGGLGALVFSLFLAYDTQSIMGGRKYELEPEEYIFGSLQLYVDVVYIFLFLLMCFGGRD